MSGRTPSQMSRLRCSSMQIEGTHSLSRTGGDGDSLDPRLQLLPLPLLRTHHCRGLHTDAVTHSLTTQRQWRQRI
jgi:hypothetical protein